MPSSNQTQPQPRQLPKLSIALLVMTTLAAFVALALLWAVVGVTSSNTSTISNAERAAFATPLLWFGVAIIAIVWIALWRWLRWRYIAIPIVITIVAASLAGVFFWRSQTIDQPVSIIAYQCATGENPFSNEDSIRSSCVPSPDAPQLTIGAANDRNAYTSESTTTDTQARVEGLPVGSYYASMSTTGPLETAFIVLATKTEGGIKPLGMLTQDDPFSGGSGSWSTSVRISPDTDTYVLLYYMSPEPVIPDARISFSIQQCTNTSPTAFDASGCTPMTGGDWLLQDVTSETGPPTFRQPVRTRDGASVTYSNLESRTYRFTPLIENQAVTSSSYGFMVMPTDGPQTADANILAISPDTRQEEFSVDINPDTLEHAFTIYVFPTQNTYADTVDSGSSEGLPPT